MNATTHTHNGRTFTMETQETSSALAMDLMRRGFDGVVWFGVSLPAGRQRKALHGMFYRTLSGKFECVRMFS